MNTYSDFLKETKEWLSLQELNRVSGRDRAQQRGKGDHSPDAVRTAKTLGTKIYDQTGPLFNSLDKIRGALSKKKGPVFKLADELYDETRKLSQKVDKLAGMIEDLV